MILTAIRITCCFIFSGEIHLCCNDKVDISIKIGNINLNIDFAIREQHIIEAVFFFQFFNHIIMCFSHDRVDIAGLILQCRESNFAKGIIFNSGRSTDRFLIVALCFLESKSIISGRKLNAVIFFRNTCLVLGKSFSSSKMQVTLTIVDFKIFTVMINIVEFTICHDRFSCCRDPTCTRTYNITCCSRVRNQEETRSNIIVYTRCIGDIPNDTSGNILVNIFIVIRIITFASCIRINLLSGCLNTVFRHFGITVSE